MLMVYDYGIFSVEVSCVLSEEVFDFSLVLR